MGARAHDCGSPGSSGHAWWPAASSRQEQEACSFLVGMPQPASVRIMQMAVPWGNVIHGRDDMPGPAVSETTSNYT